MTNVQVSGNMHRNGSTLIITGPVETIKNQYGRVVGFRGLMEVESDGEPTLEDRIELIHTDEPDFTRRAA